MIKISSPLSRILTSSSAKKHKPADSPTQRTRPSLIVARSMAKPKPLPDPGKPFESKGRESKADPPSKPSEDEVDLFEGVVGGIDAATKKTGTGRPSGDLQADLKQGREELNADD